MNYEEESELSAQFIDEADSDHITDVLGIKAIYDERIGHKTGRAWTDIMYCIGAWMDKETRVRRTQIYGS